MDNQKRLIDTINITGRYFHNDKKWPPCPANLTVPIEHTLHEVRDAVLHLEAVLIISVDSNIKNCKYNEHLMLYLEAGT